MTDYIIPLDDKSAPLYEQIYHFIREEIKSGNLPAKTRLPSTRKLSQSLGVSRSTVQLAYDQLVAEGYLTAEACRGYFAAELDVLLQMEKTEAPTGERPAKRKPEPAETPMPVQIDFSPRGIALEHFPFNIWRKLSREILTMDNKELFSSGDPQGEPGLREEIRAYLKSARLVDCRAEQIVVGAGSEYLLMLLNQILGPHGIAMENPTYRQAYRVFTRLGHSVVPVPMDGSGMEVEALRHSGAKIAYIMPSHQFPTGIVMPARRRQELLAWALEEADHYLIEDDYDSEFRYRGKPIPALYGSDQSGRVIYLGTFSKAVAPAIRVSYMVLPEHLLTRYQERCGFYASTVSRVDQEILTHFLRDGHFERHLNRMRSIYRTRHDALLAALEPLRADFDVHGDMAGLHVLLESRSGRSEEELIGLAGEAGIRVYGLSAYQIGGQATHTVILGYANLSVSEIQNGVRRLAEVWRKGEEE